MPKISKDTAPDVATSAPAIDRGGQLDGYTVNFVTIRESHSLAPLLKGLPGDSLPVPALGLHAGGQAHRQLPGPRGGLPGRAMPST